MLILTCTLLVVLLALLAFLGSIQPFLASSAWADDTPRAAERQRAAAVPAAAAFVRALIRNPRAVGACCPSSPRLARAVAATVDPSADGLIVELGGGTGAITAALLARGVRPERLLVVERDPSLARHLQQRFRSVRVIAADANDLAGALARHGHGARVATVVSSLPMISLSKGEVREIGTQICAVLEHGGALVQYTYQMALGHARTPGCLELVLTDRVWLNVPPARVELYRHRD